MITKTKTDIVPQDTSFLLTASLANKRPESRHVTGQTLATSAPANATTETY